MIFYDVSVETLC